MIRDKFTLTKTIQKDCSNDYIAICYPVEYKDKYQRENDVEMNFNKPASYLRLSYEFDDQLKTVKEIDLPDNYRFSPLPYIPLKNEQERSVIYLSGGSGGGKSFLINSIITFYKKFFPKNPVYFITKNDWKSDRSLDKELYTFVNVEKFIEKYSSKEAIEEFLLTKDYNDSFFVFDDIGASEKISKEADKTLWTIIDIILENKRKAGISIAIISHVPTNYKKNSFANKRNKTIHCFP